jgi:hypothetical protein
VLEGMPHLLHLCVQGAPEYVCKSVRIYSTLAQAVAHLLPGSHDIVSVCCHTDSSDSEPYAPVPCLLVASALR